MTKIKGGNDGPGGRNEHYDIDDKASFHGRAKIWFSFISVNRRVVMAPARDIDDLERGFQSCGRAAVDSM